MRNYHFIKILAPRISLVRNCRPFPVEFVVRGYLTGTTETSIWTHYERGEREYCGYQLPDGLDKNVELPTPIVTPTTKNITDIVITASEIVDNGLMTQSQWDYCHKTSLELFARGQELAAKGGLILVDTKYEFGIDEDGVIRLIDEIHTPDSSRYWVQHSYQTQFQQDEELVKMFPTVRAAYRCSATREPQASAVSEESG